MFSFQGTAGQPRNILDQSPVRIPRGYVPVIHMRENLVSDIGFDEDVLQLIHYFVLFPIQSFATISCTFLS